MRARRDDGAPDGHRTGRRVRVVRPELGQHRDLIGLKTLSLQVRSQLGAPQVRPGLEAGPGRGDDDRATMVVHHRCIVLGLDPHACRSSRCERGLASSPSAERPAGAGHRDQRGVGGRLPVAGRTDVCQLSGAVPARLESCGAWSGSGEGRRLSTERSATPGTDRDRTGGTSRCPLPSWTGMSRPERPPWPP